MYIRGHYCNETLTKFEEIYILYSLLSRYIGNCYLKIFSLPQIANLFKNVVLSHTNHTFVCLPV